MSTPVPLLALALALCGLILLVALIWHRRWLELAIVVLVGCAMALYFERGRRGPDTVGTTVAEVVNEDRSLSLHVRVKPGTTVYCTSDYTASIPPSGPLADSALWFVELYPKYISGSFPLVADADGNVVVTLPAGLLDVGPVHIQFNGKDQGTTRLAPDTPSAAEKPHAEAAESAENVSVVSVDSVVMSTGRNPGKDSPSTGLSTDSTETTESTETTSR